MHSKEMGKPWIGVTRNDYYVSLTTFHFYNTVLHVHRKLAKVEVTF